MKYFTGAAIFAAGVVLGHTMGTLYGAALVKRYGE